MFGTKFNAIVASLLLFGCGATVQTSTVESLRTPHGFYQNIWEYRIVGSDVLQRSQCYQNDTRTETRCDLLTEEVSVQKTKSELLRFGRSIDVVAKTFEKVRSLPVDYVRVSDLETPSEERLAAMNLDSAFLAAGRGLAPTHLNHSYLKYLEVYSPSIEFELTGDLIHTASEPSLYTYNFYFQDSRIRMSSDSIDAQRETCRLSSVVKQVKSGVWKLKTQQSVPSLRLTFERGQDTLWLSCGMILSGSGEPGARETTSTGTLTSFNRNMGTHYIRNFSVVR